MPPFLNVGQQVAGEGYLWYHYLGGLVGSLGGIAFFWWLLRQFVLRFFKKTDQTDAQIAELKSEHEEGQDKSIAELKDRLDEISKWMSLRDSERGTLVNRRLVDKLFDDEKDIREKRDDQQDKRLDVLEKKLFNGSRPI